MEAHLEVMEEVGRQIDFPFLRSQNLQLRTMVLELSGDPDAADEVAEQCLQVGAERWPEDALIIWASNALVTAWVRGEVAQHVEMAEQSVHDNPGMAVFEAVLAWAYAYAGRTQEASTLMDQARERRFAHRRDQTRLVSQGLWCEAAWLLGDAASAEVLAPLMEPWAGRLVTTHSSFAQAASHYAGIARATPRDDDPFQIGQRELTRELIRNFAHERPFIAPGRRSPAASAGRLLPYAPLPRR